MKASELIETLQLLQQRHGDLNVSMDFKPVKSVRVIVAKESREPGKTLAKVGAAIRFELRATAPR